VARVGEGEAVPVAVGAAVGGTVGVADGGGVGIVTGVAGASPLSGMGVAVGGGAAGAGVGVELGAPTAWRMIVTVLGRTDSSVNPAGSWTSTGNTCMPGPRPLASLCARTSVGDVVEALLHVR
jgi:hypothetical protein